MEGQKKSVFETLNEINVNDKKEKKNGLDYLSWAYAWGIVKSNYPNATYTVYEDSRGLNYFTDGRTCYVKVGVTIESLEMVEYLPVMDFRNASIVLDKVTSFDVNKAIQRCLTKALARHGLGLYIYAGEDLPDGEEPEPKKPVKKEEPKPKPKGPDKLYSIRDIDVIIEGTDMTMDRVRAWAEAKFQKKIEQLEQNELYALCVKLKMQLGKE